MIDAQISEPAVRSLIKGYLDMRNMVGRGTKTISATPRQLESLIRLSEGLAKMRHARCERVLPRDFFLFLFFVFLWRVCSARQTNVPIPRCFVVYCFATGGCIVPLFTPMCRLPEVRLVRRGSGFEVYYGEKAPNVRLFKSSDG